MQTSRSRLDDSRWDNVRLQGEQFVLRRWRPDDVEALLEHANDPLLPRGLSDRFPHPYTRADAEAFLAGNVIDFANPVFAIEIQGQACGGISAMPSKGERSIGAEMGYWLSRRYWGQGQMTRIVGQFAPWVMDALRLQRLQATVLAFNIGSARVLQKNGFVQEGVLRRAVRKDGAVHDLLLFARIRETQTLAAAHGRDCFSPGG